MRRVCAASLAGALALCVCPLASSAEGESATVPNRGKVASESTENPKQQTAGESLENPEEEDISLVETEPIVSRPIEEGFVVFDGRYVPAPYIVEQSGDNVFVNDRLIPYELGSRRGFGMGSGFGLSRWRGSGGERRSFLFSQTEQQLGSGGLLFVFEEGASGFIVPQNSLAVLDILLSDASEDEKSLSLADGRYPRFDSAEWAGIVEGFESTSDLIERIDQIEAENTRLLEESLAARQRVELLDSAPVRYGVTVIAMVLVVIAFGSLLNDRPMSNARWSDIDQSGDRVAMVTRNVVLLALLNGFDLALTLVAQQAGGFMELNPLGAKLAAHPAYLAAFKLTALLGSCLILMMLRKYRGAQTASWWLCLLCTILTFRWLTYNSMFLS